MGHCLSEVFSLTGNHLVSGLGEASLWSRSPLAAVNSPNNDLLQFNKDMHISGWLHTALDFKTLSKTCKQAGKDLFVVWTCTELRGLKGFASFCFLLLNCQISSHSNYSDPIKLSFKLKMKISKKPSQNSEKKKLQHRFPTDLLTSCQLARQMCVS